MYPVLFTIAGWPVSSFGFFLALALTACAFTVWRLCLVYDYDKEQTLDLVLLTFFGSFFGARIYFILFHLNLFLGSSIYFDRMFQIYLYPGLSFWGAFLGGIMTLVLFSNRLKINFWQVADIGIVGFFIAMFFGSVGCLLNTCQYGIPSNLLIAVPQEGLIGRRFPVQILEAILYLIVFFLLWKRSLKFHVVGKIFAIGLIYLGFIKLFTESLRGDQFNLFGVISLGHLYSLILIIYGITAYYRLAKRSVKEDLTHLLQLVTNSKKREVAISRFIKRCYTLVINWRFFLERKQKALLKRFNVIKDPPKT